MICFRGASQPGDRWWIFFAGQGPANKDPLRIPSGIEAIPVKSGQQETSVGFFLSLREIKSYTCLDRGGARLPGDRCRIFFRRPAKFPPTSVDFSAREKKSYTCPKKNPTLVLSGAKPSGGIANPVLGLRPSAARRRVHEPAHSELAGVTPGGGRPLHADRHPEQQAVRP